MYERGEEIAQRVLEFIRENQLFDGLDDHEYDEALDGFYDYLESVSFESTEV